MLENCDHVRCLIIGQVTTPGE